MRIHWSHDGTRNAACGQRKAQPTRTNPYPGLPFTTRVPAEVTCRRRGCYDPAAEYGMANGWGKPESAR